MPLKKMKKLKDAFQKLLNPIPICKNCFKNLDNANICYLFNKDIALCCNCMNQFEPKFQRFKIGNIKALALFDYDEKMRDLIYRFKGCYDYELRTIFLDMFKRELSLFYKGYTIVPAPSFKDDDLRRGFNHVEEIFRSLKLDMVLAFEKDQQFKQADHNFKERKLIDKHIKLKENIELKDNILLVDDIYTTGSTMNAMISLLKSKGIKKIKVLVLCKTKLNEITKGNLMQ